MFKFLPRAGRGGTLRRRSLAAPTPLSCRGSSRLRRQVSCHVQTLQPNPPFRCHLARVVTLARILRSRRGRRRGDRGPGSRRPVPEVRLQSRAVLPRLGGIRRLPLGGEGRVGPRRRRWQRNRVPARCARADWSPAMQPRRTTPRFQPRAIAPRSSVTTPGDIQTKRAFAAMKLDSPGRVLSRAAPRVP